MATFWATFGKFGHPVFFVAFQHLVALLVSKNSHGGLDARKQVSKYVVLIVVVPCGGAFAFILGFRVPYSETRFDEFSPLCHNVIKIRPF